MKLHKTVNSNLLTLGNFIIPPRRTITNNYHTTVHDGEQKYECLSTEIKASIFCQNEKAENKRMDRMQECVSVCAYV